MNFTVPWLLEQLVQLESDVRYQAPPDQGEPEFRYEPGSLPVLLSAPHGAAHTRNGRMKEEDGFTAGFARLVARLAGAHVLYVRRQSATDPNYHTDAPYKKYLEEIVRSRSIQFVMDIHGAGSRHGFGIALGTMSGRSCPRQYPLILETLARHGFTPEGKRLERLDLDQLFTGGGGRRQETVTRYCHDVAGVSAAQFELNPHLRIVHLHSSSTYPEPFIGDEEMILRAVETFVDLAHGVVQ